MRYEDTMEDYIWKGSKKRVGNETFQETIRLLDASEEQLNKFYKHCKSMLYNSSKIHPGRYKLLSIISEQSDKCGVELFLRDLEAQKMTRFSFATATGEFIDNNIEAIKHFKEINGKEYITLNFMTQNCPDQYKDLPLPLILDGCWDRLGKFNRQHITLTFILRQGVWFTSQEGKNLIEKDENGNIRNKLDVVKERLLLKPETELIVHPKGLNYAQLRAMVQLTSKKYSDLTTEQLLTLRTKILFLLEKQTKLHISQWEKRMAQIEEVAKHKGFSLN